MYFLKKYRRGIKNKYRRGMPVFEMLLKDINHTIIQLLNYFKNGFKHKNALCFPHYPSRRSALYIILRKLNYTITNRPGKFDLVIYWEYLTFRKEFHLMDKIAENKPVINLYSRNISKKNVDEHFKRVFGYATAVDPLVYEGKCVKKNNINAIHDGQIIHCPVKSKDENFIYQLLIDNSTDEGCFLDYRTLIMGKEIPFVYLKFRYKNQQFKHPFKAILDKPENVFSKHEMAKILALANSMKLDFGEMDVLRNRKDGKIYVVDVNNTPQSPRAYMDKKGFQQALNIMCQSFKKAFIEK